MFGCSLGNLGRYEESLRVFDRALELGHECENCWYNRAIAYTALGRRQETIAALERVTQFNPEHVRAWLDLGMVLAGFRLPEHAVGEPFDGRQERAVACFDVVIAKDPACHEAWLGGGLVLERIAHQAQVRNRTAATMGAPELPFDGRVRAAAESFDRATALRPENQPAAEAKESLYVGLFGEDRAHWPSEAIR